MAARSGQCTRGRACQSHGASSQERPAGNSNAWACRVHEDVDDGLQVFNVRRLRLVHLAAHEHDLCRRLHRLFLVLCAHGRARAGHRQIHRRCRNCHWRSGTAALSKAPAVLYLIEGNAQAPRLLGRVTQLQHVGFGLVKDAPDILVVRVLDDLIRRREVRLVAPAVVARICHANNRTSARVCARRELKGLPHCRAGRLC